MNTLGTAVVGIFAAGIIAMVLTTAIVIVGTLLYATIRDLMDRTQKIRNSAMHVFDLPPSSRFTPIETPILEN